MPKKILPFFAGLLSFTFLFLSNPPLTHAADLGVSIYPPIVRVTIKPGKSISQVFKIDNLSDSDKFFVARLLPFNKGDVLGNPEVSPDSTADWLSYFTLANSNIKLGEPFQIKTGESDQIILNLAVPDMAALKDLYVTLLVSSYNPELDSTSQGSIISGSIAANLLISVTTTAFPSTVLSMSSITPTEGSFLKFGNWFIADNITPLIIASTVKNEGDFVTETKGFVRLMKGDSPVELQAILPQNIISKSRRELKNSNGENFHLNPTLSNFGLHRFEIEIHSDNSNVSGYIEIFFLPLKALSGFALGLALLIIIAKIINKPLTHQ